MVSLCFGKSFVGGSEGGVDVLEDFVSVCSVENLGPFFAVAAVTLRFLTPCFNFKNKSINISGLSLSCC
jgi:hypothetical protein